jgi:hypothetical protein
MSSTAGISRSNMGCVKFLDVPAIQLPRIPNQMRIHVRRNEISMADDDGGATELRCADQQSPGAPNSALDPDDFAWCTPLWDDDWTGEIGLFGDVYLCVAAKKWADGTVDVFVAHDPHAAGGPPSAYAHRHGPRVTSVTVHGRATAVIQTVTRLWGPPQKSEAEPHNS